MMTLLSGAISCAYVRTLLITLMTQCNQNGRDECFFKS